MELELFIDRRRRRNNERQSRLPQCNVSKSPIVRVLNYLAVTAPSEELFESLLLDMQTLGCGTIAVPQQYISNARNKFNTTNAKNTVDNSNSLNLAAADEVVLLLGAKVRTFHRLQRG